MKNEKEKISAKKITLVENLKFKIENCDDGGKKKIRYRKPARDKRLRTKNKGDFPLFRIELV